MIPAVLDGNVQSCEQDQHGDEDGGGYEHSLYKKTGLVSAARTALNQARPPVRLVPSTSTVPGPSPRKLRR